MQAIATTLDPDSEAAIQSLWQRFEANCGLVGIESMALAHFSWMSADAFQHEPLNEALAAIAHEQAPFAVYTAGLGIFTGPHPIVYVPVAKSAALLALHQTLWEAARPFAITPNLLYDPERWMPHITLAYQNSDAARLGCAVSDIAFQAVELTIWVDELVLLGHTMGQGEVICRYPFGKG